MLSPMDQNTLKQQAAKAAIAYVQDELRYAIRKELFLQPNVEAMTMRNNAGQTALAPMVADGHGLAPDFFADLRRIQHLHDLSELEHHAYRIEREQARHAADQEERGELEQQTGGAWQVRH